MPVVARLLVREAAQAQSMTSAPTFAHSDAGERRGYSLWPTQSPAGTALTVAAFGVAYYVAGMLSLVSRFPSSGTTMIWLGTPVLLAVMLVVPPRKWWLYCLALVPFHLHLILTFRGPVPLLVMLTQAAGNCATAALAATALRPLIGVPPRLVGLRNVSLFILIACVAVPAIVSGAVVFAFEKLGYSPDFLHPWRARSLSNAIGDLIVVPLTLWVITGGIRAVRNAPRRRYLEVSVLVVALVVVALIVFGESAQSGGFVALLYAPLLLLLWAAVRFDLAGLCAALLVIALASLSHAVAGRGPFTHGSLVENVLALQLFLFAVAVPLVLLSAVIREQHETLNAVRSVEAALRTGYGQIRDLAQRLVSAQEAERRRIARDLHDDLSQQLALLSLDIGLLRQHAPASHALSVAVGDLGKRARAIAEGVHGLSRQLHPSRLETLGLVAAIQGVCSDISAQHSVTVDFHHQDVPETVDPDVALSLYRIVQEALQNVVKHSGTNAARVSLVGSADVLDLSIADHGVGFGTDKASLAGIGLISMRERVGFAGGTITVDSAPGVGTRIDITVPLRIEGKGDAESAPGVGAQ